MPLVNKVFNPHPVRVRENSNGGILQPVLAPLQGTERFMNRAPGATRYALAPGYLLLPFQGT